MHRTAPSNLRPTVPGRGNNFCGRDVAGGGKATPGDQTRGPRAQFACCVRVAGPEYPRRERRRLCVPPEDRWIAVAPARWPAPHMRRRRPAFSSLAHATPWLRRPHAHGLAPRRRVAFRAFLLLSTTYRSLLRQEEIKWRPLASRVVRWIYGWYARYEYLKFIRTGKLLRMKIGE